MNPDTIALLRAESLAATLAATRSRRVRRRAGRLALAAVVCAVTALSILPRRAPVPAISAAPLVPREIRIIPTPPVVFARITTRTTGSTLVRFTTAPATRVERIDTSGLAHCFPDKGIAVIHAEGELAKVVVF